MDASDSRSMSLNDRCQPDSFDPPSQIASSSSMSLKLLTEKLSLPLTPASSSSLLHGLPSKGSSASTELKGLGEEDSILDNQPIYLNVGGKRFCTTRRTLCVEDSFLASMFSGRFNENHFVRDETGAFFLDLDPHCFSSVLDLLRLKVLDPHTRHSFTQIGATVNPQLKATVHYLGLSNLLAYEKVLCLCVCVSAVFCIVLSLLPMIAHLLSDITYSVFV